MKFNDCIEDVKAFLKVVSIITGFIVLMVSLRVIYALYLEGAMFDYVEVHGAYFMLIAVSMLGNIFSGVGKLSKISKLEKTIALKTKENKELINLIKKEEA